MPSIAEFPVLQTPRLTLRRPTPRDADALWLVTKDEAVMHYYGMGPFESREEALDEIAWMRREFRQEIGIRWIVTERGRDAYIGDIGLHIHQPVHARAELGYKLARAYWRRGLMGEALAQVLAYGFEVMGLNRIEALVDPRNAASLGLLKAAGFQAEGLLREYEREPAGFVDLIMLALLRREHQARTLAGVAPGGAG